VTLPAREAPARTFLRARVPDGWRVHRATVDGRQLSVDETGATELTGLTGHVRVRFEVGRSK